MHLSGLVSGLLFGLQASAIRVGRPAVGELKKEVCCLLRSIVCRN
jgi:hypothetical protein